MGWSEGGRGALSLGQAGREFNNGQVNEISLISGPIIYQGAAPNNAPTLFCSFVMKKPRAIDFLYSKH